MQPWEVQWGASAGVARGCTQNCSVLSSSCSVQCSGRWGRRQDLDKWFNWVITKKGRSGNAAVMQRAPIVVWSYLYRPWWGCTGLWGRSSGGVNLYIQAIVGLHWTLALLLLWFKAIYIGYGGAALDSVVAPIVVWSYIYRPWWAALGLLLSLSGVIYTGHGRAALNTGVTPFVVWSFLYRSWWGCTGHWGRSSHGVMLFIQAMVGLHWKLGSLLSWCASIYTGHIVATLDAGVTPLMSHSVKLFIQAMVRLHWTLGSLFSYCEAIYMGHFGDALDTTVLGLYWTLE